ncbi:MAG: NAD(P)/FAD-dependent oxidoreductase [Leptospiraceae bacterium]|nr:NAD(P)/FAD-dependent oxidoreductase [Leptospiraceae bacterium]
MHEIDTLVIGAGPSGISISALLGQYKIPYITIEKNSQVGSAWRTHYERLHLHTIKSFSHLPMMPFPKDYPRYVSRDLLVSYMEEYCKRFEIKPGYNETAEKIIRKNNKWEITTNKESYFTNRIVVCAGYNHSPIIPEWEGMENFKGEIIHSKDYKNNKGYKGKSILIIGAGNTGGELAIDLWEGGSKVDICIRGPLHVVPRDYLGIPMNVTANLLHYLPIGIADTFSKIFLKLTTKDLSKFGIKKPKYGSVKQLKYKEKVALVDIGTSELIYQEQIKVRPGIQKFTKDSILFEDGSEGSYDTVICCTGFSPNLHPLFPGLNLWNEKGYPNLRGKEVMNGLYFLGYTNHLTGFLKNIGVEAKYIAKDIKSKFKK